MNDYQKHHKRISGYLKSSLRKRNSNIAYDNMINSEYIFFEYLNLKENEEKKYKPKILIIQIILNLVLLGITYYLLSVNLIFLIKLYLVLIFLNYFIMLAYSFVSILINRFKKRENKRLWLFLILFLPFSAFFYPDFRKIQVETN
jgi:hypothetical protein